MFKLIKLTFFSVFVFAGLYFFGDFRVNDTNVKDFLQKKVTIQNIVTTKNTIVRTYSDIMRFMEVISDKLPTGEAVSLDSSTKSKRAVNPLSEKPLDQLSSKDRKQMINLLKSLDK